MAIEKLTALKNVAEVVENPDVEVVTSINVATAVAYEESKDAAEKVEEIIDELTAKAEEIIPETPEAPEVKAKNIYTKKLTLDESIDDFKIKPELLSDESDEDEYLDYDMFDFIYGLVSDSWPKPKNPLDHPMRKFRAVGADSYDDNENTGTPQVSTDENGDIVIYADAISDFTDIRNVCDFYHITYKDVVPRKSENSRWKYNMTITVPKTASDYPMMAEDFFEAQGLSMSDVIEDHKVGGGKSANWGTTYQTKASRDRDNAEKLLNDDSVKTIVDEYKLKAANSNDPLEDFIKAMFKELDDKGLVYSKSTLRKDFLAYFEDDFEDEE